MSRTKSKITRVSPDFEEWAKKIAKIRYVNGLDKKELRLPRITKAITNVPNLRKVLEESRIDG